MTLDEAIKHCEEVVYQKDLESGFDTDNERYAMTDKEREDCIECANEHRQLAMWLKDYKRLLEQQSEDCVSRADVRHLIAESFEKNLLGMTNKMFETLYKGIDELPPVTPTQSTCKNCEYMKKDKFGHHCCKCHWCVMDSYKDMIEHFYCADFEKRGDENEVN